jgi:hypothetical protein
MEEKSLAFVGDQTLVIPSNVSSPTKMVHTKLNDSETTKPEY